jgi:hypothetical protein
LHHLGEELSPFAGLHVEFKIDSLRRFKKQPVTMFSYDLVGGHRILEGGDELFKGAEHHLQASNITLSEATRLLFNRCSGLLLATELLRSFQLNESDSDFIYRNLCKAQLALGDALLVACQGYHWSCIERHKRLHSFMERCEPPWVTQVVGMHETGVKFKLNPEIPSHPRGVLLAELQTVSRLAEKVWLWIESLRLNFPFKSPREYALDTTEKCPEFPGWKNLLVSLRTFGWRAAADSLAYRYPRERLLNTLPVLLWETGADQQPELCDHLQRQLRTTACAWPGWVDAYKQVWPAYG